MYILKDLLLDASCIHLGGVNGALGALVCTQNLKKNQVTSVRVFSGTKL